MARRNSYQEEAKKLAKAIDIATEAFKTHLPQDWEETHLNHIIFYYTEWKNEVLNPEPPYKNLNSLKYQIENVFTYFQEAKGKTVEYFWNRIKEEGL